MCLSTIDKKVSIRLDKDGVGEGYKVFTERQGLLFGEFTTRHRPRPVGVWLKAEDFSPSLRVELEGLLELRGYSPGWHIFKTKIAAERWWHEYFDSSVVRKVLFRGVLVTGRTELRGRLLKIIVASEIMILREE